MNRLLCPLLALGVCAGSIARARADYAFTAIDFPGALQTYAEGINASGQVVGSYLGQDSKRHGFLLSGGTYTSFDVPGAFLFTDPYAINSSGQIVGRYGVSSTAISGFLLNGDAYTTLDVPGSMYTEARGINAAGQVCGFSATALYSSRHGFLLSNGIYTSVDVPNSMETIAQGINNTGQIIGAYVDSRNIFHGFIRSGDNYATIDFQGSSYTAATAINNSGQIVGFTMVGATGHGFMLDESGYKLVDVPGSIQTVPGGFNDAGEIVGSYGGTDDRAHGFLAIPIAAPVPEPSSVVLLGLGIAGLLACTWLGRTRSARA